jgi:ATP-dependent Lon protease
MGSQNLPSNPASVNCLDLLKKIVDLAPNVSEEIYITAINQESAYKLADYAASNLNLSIADKQDLLETYDVQKRMEEEKSWTKRLSEMSKSTCR